MSRDNAQLDELMRVFALEPELARTIAEAIRPRRRVRPSEWARENVVLSAEQAERAGPMDVDWKPWTRAVIDIEFDHPDKLGSIGLKPGQIGWSMNVLAALACAIVTDPCPMLYICQDAAQAAEFSDERIGAMRRSCPELARAFGLGGQDRRDLLSSKPFPGGKIDFAGAGSEGALISTSYARVYIDEYEVVCDNFPARSGTPFETARVRTNAYPATRRIHVFAHPRDKDGGIHRLYLALSDHGRWVFDCPHCGAMIDPTNFDRVVRAGRVDEAGRKDWESARLVCPACSAEITDAQRARAVWGKERGGSGRLHSPMSEKERANREFVGVWVHRLCDPDITVRALARLLWEPASAGAKKTAYNKEAGEPVGAADVVVTESMVRELVASTDRVLPRSVRYVTLGVDVQAPRHNPTLYCVAKAFAPGMSYIVDAVRLSGWDALFDYLQRVSWVKPTSDVDICPPHGGASQGHGVEMCTIDAGYETGQVLEFVRRTIYSGATGRRVKMLAVKYVAQAHADNPVIKPPKRKLEHPTRPELGDVNYLYLHRHSWVDRAMRRIQEKRVRFLCPLPSDWEAQLMSNLLRPVKAQHGMASDQVEWVRPDEMRDDWLQAMVYAEAGAAIEMKLDRMYESEAPMEVKRREPSGYTRRREGGSWWNR